MSLLTKYRPQKWDEVVGHGPGVKMLEKLIAAKEEKAFLFSGPSGVGKTTLARLAAKELGAEVREFKAAVQTGIDDVRRIIEQLQYRSMMNDRTAFIVDECHALSKQAWQALLADVEEPPDWVYWFFCTTEPGKVPKTIKTRCVSLSLGPVSVDDLDTLIRRVVKKEKLALSKGVAELCVDMADGSPRQMLANLATVMGATNIAEAEKLLTAAQADAGAIDLCRALGGAAGWITVAKILGSLPDDLDPEGVRRVVSAYFSKVALGGKSLHRSLAILEAFSVPFLDRSSLILACGKLVARDYGMSKV